MAVYLSDAQKRHEAEELVRTEKIIARTQQETAELNHARKELAALNAALAEAEEVRELSTERANRYNEAVDAAQIEAQAVTNTHEAFKESLNTPIKEVNKDRCSFDFKNNTTTIKSSRALIKPKNTAQATQFATNYLTTDAKTLELPMAVASRMEALPTALSNPSVVWEAHISPTVTEKLQSHVISQQLDFNPVIIKSTYDLDGKISIETDKGATVTQQTDPDNLSGSSYTVKHPDGLSEKAQAINAGVLLAHMMAAEYTNKEIIAFENDAKYQPTKSVYAAPAGLRKFLSDKNSSQVYALESIQGYATACKLAIEHENKYSITDGEHIIDPALVKGASWFEKFINAVVTPSVAPTDQSQAVLAEKPATDVPASTDSGLKEVVTVAPEVANVAPPSSTASALNPVAHDTTAVEVLEAKPEVANVAPLPAAVPQSPVVTAAIAKNPSVDKDAVAIRKEDSIANTKQTPSSPGSGASNH